MSRLIYVIPVMVMCLLGGLFYTSLKNGSGSNLPSAVVGGAAPELPTLALTGFEGEELASLLDQNEFVLVNFFASWCGPCRAEHPNLQALKDLGIPIIGINYKDKPEKATQFLTELGNPYASVLADNDGRIAINWGVSGVPETFFVDKKGVVIYRFFGPITAEKLKSEVLPLIKS